MKTAISALSLLVIGVAVGTAAGWLLHYYLKPQIRGGYTIDLIKRPGFLSLQVKKTASSSFQHNCGAAFIGPGLVLTAAHCLPGAAGGSMRFVPSADLRAVSRSHTPVSSAIVHPSLDIALVEVMPTYAGDTVTLVKMSANDYWKQKQVYALGWGFLHSFKPLPTLLREARIAVDPLRKSAGSRLWAGDGHVGPCVGDSGGPLLLDRPGSHQIGVLHFADACSSLRYDAEYVSVAAAASWICESVPAGKLSTTNAELCRLTP